MVWVLPSLNPTPENRPAPKRTFHLLIFHFQVLLLLVSGRGNFTIHCRHSFLCPRTPPPQVLVVWSLDWPPGWQSMKIAVLSNEHGETHTLSVGWTLFYVNQPSRELTYSTLGKSSSNVPWDRIWQDMLVSRRVICFDGLFAIWKDTTFFVLLPTCMSPLKLIFTATFEASCLAMPMFVC